MSTKTIILEAYERLKREKMEEESLSDVILRLTERKKDILEFAGTWKDFDEVVEIILKGREEFESMQKFCLETTFIDFLRGKESALRKYETIKNYKHATTSIVA